MSILGDAWKNFLEKGFKITVKKDWPGEEKLKVVHPSNVERTDAMDDIVASMEKLYKCNSCAQERKQSYILRCTKCDEFICSSCYTIINKRAWCKECLKKRK